MSVVVPKASTDRPRQGRRIQAGVVLLVIAFSAWASAWAGEAESGTVILVGGVLTYNEKDVWQRIVDVAGGEQSEIVVISAAHDRSRVYGEYARRALMRYAPFVELLPIAATNAEFGSSYREQVHDSSLVSQVANAQAIFFVGGAPQRLAGVLFDDEGTPTPLAKAVKTVYASGGVVVGGVPEYLGTDLGLDHSDALRTGRIADQHHYMGLGLLSREWYVDQYLFSPTRLVQALIAMRQHAIAYGIGVEINTMAIIDDGRLEVVGSGGVAIFHMKHSTNARDDRLTGIRGVRIGYLRAGDTLDLTTLEVTPHQSRLDGFRIDNSGTGGRHVDTGGTPSISISAENVDLGGGDLRLVFRADAVTAGWVEAESGQTRFTARNIHLDVVENRDCDPSSRPNVPDQRE
jgi:cyanophycinase